MIKEVEKRRDTGCVKIRAACKILLVAKALLWWKIILTTSISTFSLVREISLSFHHITSLIFITSIKTYDFSTHNIPHSVKFHCLCNVMTAWVTLWKIQHSTMEKLFHIQINSIDVNREWCWKNWGWLLLIFFAPTSWKCLFAVLAEKFSFL